MRFALLVTFSVFLISARGQADSDSRFEVSSVPLLGYSTSTGFGLGANFGFGYRFSDRWQITTDLIHFGYTKSGSSTSSLLAGIQVGFFQESGNSTFLGAGGGYEITFENLRRPVAYVRGGWRRTVSEKHAISWSPAIRMDWLFDNSGRIHLEPVRFSVTF